MSLKIERTTNVGKRTYRTLPYDLEHRIVHDYLVKQKSSKQVAEKYGIPPQKVVNLSQKWSYKKTVKKNNKEEEFATIKVPKDKVSLVGFLLSENGITAYEIIESSINQK